MQVTQQEFRTTKDQLVLLIPELKKETDGGVIIPESVLLERLKDRGLNEFFEVVAVGADVKEIRVGNRVLVTRVQDVPVKASDSEYKIAVAREYDVVGYY